MKFYVKTKLSENISKTPEGYLLCRNVPLTHTGELRYQKGEHPFDEVEGDLIVSRTKEQLFSDKTISSFEAKSITIEHPKEFVGPENWQELSNGVVINIRPSSEKIDVDGKEEDALLGDFLITVSEAIDLVEDGLREVSLGYDAMWVQTGENTAVHENIIGNHCALVDAGRAGINCAIKDSKGEGSMSVTKEAAEKFKKFFGKTVDEAVKEKEEKETKDAEEAAKKAKDAEEKEKADKEKAAKDAEEAEKKEKESKDGDVEERMSKLEAMVAKIMEKLEGSEESEEVVADEDEESEEEESEDSDDEEEESKDEMCKDEDKDDKKSKVGDTMKRAEILAPGIKNSKDVKRQALAVAYKSKEGKKVIDSFLGGKTLKELKEVDSVFIAASELLKASRVNDFASRRAVSIDSFPALQQDGAMTPEKLNKINAERYGKK